MTPSRAKSEPQRSEPSRIPPAPDSGQSHFEKLQQLSEEAFQTFCKDISGMFGVDIECEQQQTRPESVKGLEKHFKKVVVVNSVKVEGCLNGTFQLVLDRAALFTLAGVVAMHPKQMILQNRTFGSLEKALIMSGILTEIGDTLVAAWDRVLRKALDGQVRLARTGTFIGNPWDTFEETTGVSPDGELLLIPYEVTIAPYSSFKCGAILSKTAFVETSMPPPKKTAAAPKKRKAQKLRQKENPPAKPAKSKTTTAKKACHKTPPAKESASGRLQATANNVKAIIRKNRDKTTDQTKLASEEASGTKRPPARKKPRPLTSGKENDSGPAALGGGPQKTKAVRGKKNKSANGPVSRAIKKMIRSSPPLPKDPASYHSPRGPAAPSQSPLLQIRAKDIMQKDVLWAGPNDSVQHALTSLEQHKVDWMIVGRHGAVEGILSKADLEGAISPYLRPEFARWRRPLDDATLQIRIKWIMNKSVRTIAPETSLSEIIRSMNRFDTLCLPVVKPGPRPQRQSTKSPSQQRKVQGLVTVFDVFKVLLKSKRNT